MPLMDIRAQLLAAVRQSRLSERRLSMAATGSSDTLRNIRRGAYPRVDTLEAVCKVLGLDVRISPGLLPPKEDDGVAVPPPTEFGGKLELPVFKWGDRSEEGYLRRQDDEDRVPAPVGFTDEPAFYLLMPDSLMAPGGIEQDDYCLVSPHGLLGVDQRAWFRGPKGHETVNWVMRISAAGYDLGSWYLDKRYDLRPTRIHWKHDDVAARGVVHAVYKDRPTVGKPLEPRADWRPDARAELFRAGLFSDRALLATMSSVVEPSVYIRLKPPQKARADPERRRNLGPSQDATGRWSVASAENAVTHTHKKCAVGNSRCQPKNAGNEIRTRGAVRGPVRPWRSGGKMPLMDIRAQLLAAVRQSRLSERRLSMAATGSSDTLRNIRRGAYPRVDTLEAVCKVLGLDVRISPGLLPPKEDDGVAVPPPTEISVH